MNSLAKYTIITMGTIAITGAMGVAGYTLFSGGEPMEARGIQNAAAATLQASTVSAQAAFATPGAQMSEDSDIIGMDTRMTYQYRYIKDGKLESNTEVAPYFLVGLTKGELAERMLGWEILSFSAKSIVLEKALNAASTETYIVGVKDGYVAVFYDQEVNGSVVKEVTNKPLAAFSVDEQARLEYGIRVIGEDELLKVLEDYGS